MERELIEMSPAAKEAANAEIGAKNKKYYFPFEKMNEGQSFRVEFNEIKLPVLRSTVSRAATKLKKRFKVVVHDDCYEVACIPKSATVEPVIVGTSEKTDSRQGWDTGYGSST